MKTLHACPNGHPLADGVVNCPVCGTIAGDELAPPPPADLPQIPGYRLMLELGRGGMGVVYKAWQLELQRYVALKMLRKKDLPAKAELARFQAEARAIARLQHANIVQVYDVGDIGGSPYFSLEYVDGGTLEAKLASRPQPPREAAEMLGRLAKTMDAAHRAGIVHRDLKPANILLTKSGEPKIGDFGLAKRLDSATGMNESGLILGTPGYMAPEQARGDNGAIGPAADVFALGVVGYQMLTGRVPFLGSTSYETMTQVIEQEPVSPRRLQPKVPLDLETIVLKCLRKDPAKRYASAGDLAADIDRFLTNQPIVGRPVGRIEKTRLWAKRNPAVAALLGSLAAVFLIAFLLVTWQWRDAVAATRDKTRALEIADAAKERAEKQTAVAIAAGEREAQSAAQERAARQQLEASSYMQSIQLVQREWQSGNAILADELLERIPAERRGWEWNYLRKLTHSGIVAERRNYATSIAALAYSPDGSLIATSNGNGPIHLKVAATGVLHRFLNHHTLPVVDLAFSPDGKFLASVGRDRKAVIWDMATKTVFRVYDELPETLSTVAMGPGQRFAIGWDTGYSLRSFADNGPPEQTFNAQRSRFGRSSKLAFTPDGATLATGTFNGSVVLRDVTTGNVQRTISTGTFDCTGLAFSPDGNLMATSGAAGIVKLWDLRTLTLVREYPPRHSFLSFGNVAFSANSKLLAHGGDENLVRVWNTSSGVEVRVLRGCSDAIYALGFSPTRNHIAAVSRDSTLRIWDLTRAQEVWDERPYFGKGGRWALDPSGSELLVPNDVSRAIESVRWSGPERRLGSGQTLIPYGPLTQERIGLVVVSSDGQWVAGSEGNAWIEYPLKQAPRRIFVWKRGELAAPKVLPGHDHTIFALAFHPTRPNMLVSVADDKQIKIWDVAGDAPPRTIDAEALSAAFSPDGAWLAVGGKDKLVRRWDIDKAQWLPPSPPQEHEIQMVSVSPDGETIAFWSGKYDGRTNAPIGLWSWRDNTVAELKGHRSSVRKLAFHPREPRLASGDENGNIKLWNLATRAELVAGAGHPGVINNLAFSGDGSVLLSSGWDETLRLWNGAPSPELWTFRAHKSPTTGVRFLDDTRVVSSSRDNSLRLWDADRGVELIQGIFPRTLAHASDINGLAVSADGQLLATAGSDRTVGIWELIPKEGRRPDKLHELPTKSDHVDAVAFSREGLLAVIDGFILTLWDARAGKSLRSTPAHPRDLNSVAFSADGKRFVTASDDAIVRVWTTEPAGGAFNAIELNGHLSLVTRVALSPGWLATGDLGGTVLLWNADTLVEEHAIKAHAVPVRGLAFHPTKRHLLATSGEDGVIRVWDFSGRTPQEVSRYDGHAGAVLDLAWNSKGTRLASVGEDSTVRIWKTE